MLKLGYNEATTKENSSVEQDLILCEKYGYDYIELRLDMLKKYLGSHSLTELRDFFDSHHLKPFALNSIEQINFQDEKGWNELVKLFTFACEVAEAISNPYIIVVPTMTDTYNQKNEQEVFEDTVEVLIQLSDIARPYGVKLSFEPIGDKRWCCNSQRQALEIINAVDRDDVGITVDCINFYMHDKGADIASIRKIPKEKLFVYHINDCDDLPLGVLDHSDRIMPGLGAIDIPAISAAVKEVGYDGPACLELFRPEYYQMDPEEVIRLGAEASRKYL
ncbi:MAG: sugar phosphate isomerase/epimerase [Clostridiales Family XIII bacterium]|jgi:2-keto-myo-inositol isomerase|nr:sugar phosphate isomerase/epimerase [Clostridiales Family XIII bacterium]